MANLPLSTPERILRAVFIPVEEDLPVTTFDFKPTFSALAMAAVLATLPALASAKQHAAVAGGSLSGGKSTNIEISPNSTVDFLFDVTGILSNDGFDDALNEVFNLNVGPNTRVVGIGWNVTLFADSPSWLSELAVGFGSSSVNVVNLRPGIDDEESGTKAYSSGGVLDLVGLSLDFSVGADGKLKLQFFETFDDYADDFDGRWEAGALTIRTMPIPEPATYGMMALGLFAVGAIARRRKS
jgi:PEP-CTERM motif